MTLTQILKFIHERFPYYRTCPLKWRNAIRHNLSLNDCFIKLPRDMNDENRGHYWTVKPSSEMMFDEGKYRRRKRRCTRNQNVDEILPSLVKQNDFSNHKTIPTPSDIPSCSRVPVITSLPSVIQRCGFTIDEILAPEKNIMNTNISNVDNETFVNYSLPNSFIPYYPNMYSSNPFRLYSTPKRPLVFQDDDAELLKISLRCVNRSVYMFQYM